ncbi:NF7O factor, partial [Dromaius novaehollandiae]|nr:NF7O factor [Dromaius novaehollandiae]
QQRGTEAGGCVPAGMAGRSQEQSLREELTCAICCELFTAPVMLDCMHHFCRGCIQAYWARCPHAATCPQCRRQVPGRRFRPHYLLAGLAETLRRCGTEERRHDTRVSGTAGRSLASARVCASGSFLPSSSSSSSSSGCSSRQRFSCSRLAPRRLGPHGHARQPGACQTHRLPFASAQKVSGELHCKIRAEFIRLHQILEEEERAVLAELGEEEERSLARLRRDVGRLEEEISELQRDIAHMEQTLSRMGEGSLPEVSPLNWPVQEAGGTWGSEFGLGRTEPSAEGIHNLENTLLDFSTAPDALTFDPESAHPNLVFSKDLTAVTEKERARPLPRSPRRFQQCVNVLGSRAFDSGQHYWEVWVGSKTKWDLGVAAEAVDRAAKVKLCPENGYWTLRLRNKTEYWATATPWVRLAPRRPPRKVGVFLDCREGTVAFFDAGDMSHLFTFRRVSAERYCPFFSTCFSDGQENREPMRICHLAL